MKKILIAIDYTPAAQKVAETGYAIAQALQAELVLVHVISDAAFYAADYSPIMGYKGNYTDGVVEVMKDVQTQASDFLQAVRQHLGDKNIQTMVLEGETGEAILEYANKWEADLIVIGTHSHHGLDRIFGTDTAHYFLKHSGIPMLAIPTDVKE